MDEFLKEIKELSTLDILLILEDQLDLYTTEELLLLRQELATRPDDGLNENDRQRKQCLEDRVLLEQQEREAQEMRREQQEQIRLARQRQEEETKRKVWESKVNALKSRGYEGYYEYTTLSLVDEDGGSLPTDSITNLLNRYAMDGWRLVSSYTNEIGHTSSSNSYGGYSSGTNATIDQHILILERLVKI